MSVFDRLDGTLKLSSEEQMLVESVRQLAREKIAPRAGHYDRSGEFPADNVRAINGLGLKAVFLPAAQTWVGAIPNGASTRASWRTVIGLPWRYSGQGRSLSLTSSAPSGL